jgi:hypothetical protein
MARKLRIALIFVAALAVCGVLGWLVVRSSGLLQPSQWAAPQSLVPEVNTRMHLRDGRLTSGHDKYDYDVAGAFPGLAPGIPAPADLVIVVHGQQHPGQGAGALRHGAQRAAAAASPRRGGYSWDADTHTPLAMTAITGLRRRRPTASWPSSQRLSRCPQTRCT